MPEGRQYQDRARDVHDQKHYDPADQARNSQVPDGMGPKAPARPNSRPRSKKK